MREQKWGEVVDREGQLELVERQPVLTRHQPGIVDEHIDPVVGRQEFVSQATHFGKTRKIGQQHLDPVGPGTLTDKPARRLGPGAVTTDHDNPHAGMSKAECGMQPDPGACPGDDRYRCGLSVVPRH